MGKGFDNSAPCTALKPASEIGHPAAGDIWLKVNGEMQQESTIDLHIWSVPETICYLSGLVALQPGDLIYMGTPAGVGPLEDGDQVSCAIEGIGELSTSIRR